MPSQLLLFASPFAIPTFLFEDENWAAVAKNLTIWIGLSISITLLAVDLQSELAPSITYNITVFSASIAESKLDISPFISLPIYLAKANIGGTATLSWSLANVSISFLSFFIVSAFTSSILNVCSTVKSLTTPSTILKTKEGLYPATQSKLHLNELNHGGQKRRNTSFLAILAFSS